MKILEININVCRCFTTDSLPQGYPGQLFGLRRIAELGGLRKETHDLYWFRPSTWSSNNLTSSFRRYPVCVVLREYVLYCVSSFRWYPQQPFIVQVLKRVVQILLGYKIRVLSYASVVFPCIVRVVFASYLLNDCAAGFVAKAHVPVVRSMGGP